MNFNGYAKIADQYRPLTRDPVPVSAAPVASALDLLKHLKADAVQQAQEPVHPLPPIVPVAS